MSDPQESVHPARQQLEVVAESIGAAVTHCSRDLEYLWVNRPYAQWLHRTPESIIGRPIVEIIGDEATERLRPYFDRVLAGEVVRYEEEIAFEGIGRRWIHAVYTPAPDGWVAVITDITDRRREEQRQRLRMAVTQVLTDIANTNEAIKFVLRVICEEMKWSTAAVWTVDSSGTAMRCVDFWHRADASVPNFEKDSRARTLRRGEGLPGRIWAQGSPSWIPDIERDGNFPRAPHALRDGLRTALGFPITWAGETIGVIEFFSPAMDEPDDELLALMANIGIHVGHYLEHRRAEESLRQSEARKTAILDTALDAIITIDARGRIVEFNPAAERMFGHTREQAVGQIMGDLILPPGLRERHRAGLARHVETGEDRILNRRLEMTAMRSDGSEFPVELAVTRLHQDGPPLFTGYVRDIGDRKRTEEAMLEADRRKSRFLAILAHELRNPLAPVSNAAHYLKLRALPNADLERPIEMIERQVAHMARLIDDLLDVSRISRGSLVLRTERLFLSEVVAAAVDACREAIEGRDHRLEVSLPTEPIPVEGDRHRLIQVVWNLLINAVKYTRPGGRIELSASASGDELELHVRDDGIGIASDKLGAIFELFSQVDPSIERQQGLGVGLTLAREIVELHGGRIEVSSAGLGKGSDFCVRLPVCRSGPREATAQPIELANRGLRILVADDNEDMVESSALLLESMGHEVDKAFDGASALVRAEHWRPDIVLLDIGLPDIRGDEVARRIRQQPWGRRLFLVALTGWGQDEDKLRTRESGFDAHLVKPVPPGELERVLAGFDSRNVDTPA